MKKTIYKPFILLLMFVFSSLFIIGFSYAHWNTLSTEKINSIIIGTWTNKPKDPTHIVEYIDEKYEDLKDHIIESIGSLDSEGNIILDPVFEDYNYDELKEVVDLIKEFTDNFLDSSNGNPVFLDRTIVEPIPINNINPLLPGEKQYIKQVIHAADLSSDIYWSPILFQLTMESSSGEDLSDFTVEIIIDDTPFNLTQPFSYGYRVIDPVSYNTNAISGNVENGPNVLKKINSEISYQTRVYNYQKLTDVYFRHTYSSPSFTGVWNRFSQGANIYIGQRTNSSYGMRQQYAYANPKTREGLILPGKPDGSLGELRFDIKHRKPRDSHSVSVIPLTIIISRGVEVDKNNNLLSVQRTTPIKPNINFRVVKGDMY